MTRELNEWTRRTFDAGTRRLRAEAERGKSEGHDGGTPERSAETGRPAIPPLPRSASACEHAATRMITRYGERIMFCLACGTVTYRKKTL